MTFGEAMRLQLQPEKFLDVLDEDLNIGISNGTWMASVLDKLKMLGKTKKSNREKDLGPHCAPIKQTV